MEVPAVVPIILMMMIAVIDYQREDVNVVKEDYQLLLPIVSTILWNSIWIAILLVIYMLLLLHYLTVRRLRKFLVVWKW
jgi:hypothetical protein